MEVMLLVYLKVWALLIFSVLASKLHFFLLGETQLPGTLEASNILLTKLFVSLEISQPDLI